MLSPATNTLSHHAMRSPLSPMRRGSSTRKRHSSPASAKKMLTSNGTPFVVAPPAIMFSPQEDSENSPLQIIRDQSGLMKLIKSPHSKKSRSLKYSTPATTTTTSATQTTTTTTTTTNEVSSSLPMEHARQFRGMRMKLHACQMDNEKIQEELSTYKSASMDVARQFRSARMQLHASKAEHLALKESREKFQESSEDVAAKLETRLKRMMTAAQKAQTECIQLRESNAQYAKLLILERKDNANNNKNMMTFYAAAALMTLFSALTTALWTHSTV